MLHASMFHSLIFDFAIWDVSHIEMKSTEVLTLTLLGGTCFTSWGNISKTQYYLCFT